MSVLIARTIPIPIPDSRRQIKEVDLPTEVGFSTASFAQFEITPVPGQGPAVLGRHFHLRKRERFALITGYGVLVTQDVDRKTGQLIGECQVNLVQAGDVIVVPRHTAHTFIFDVPATMTCDSTHKFDPADMPPAEPELPTAALRTMSCLEAETGEQGVALRADETFYGKVTLINYGPKVVIGGWSSPVTEDNLGEVLLRVRAELRLAGHAAAAV